MTVEAPRDQALRIEKLNIRVNALAIFASDRAAVAASTSTEGAAEAVGKSFFYSSIVQRTSEHLRATTTATFASE